MFAVSRSLLYCSGVKGKETICECWSALCGSWINVEYHSRIVLCLVLHFEASYQCDTFPQGPFRSSFVTPLERLCFPRRSQFSSVHWLCSQKEALPAHLPQLKKRSLRKALTSVPPWDPRRLSRAVRSTAHSALKCRSKAMESHFAFFHLSHLCRLCFQWFLFVSVQGSL